MQHIEFLSDHHRIVWVEDPYCLLEDHEFSLLRHRVGLKGDAVVAVESAFRQEFKEIGVKTAETWRQIHLL